MEWVRELKWPSTDVDMPQGSPTSSGQRILLVEDDADQAHLVKFLLEEEGLYSVAVAQDGVRGIQMVTDHRWDLVITDLNLPGIPGIAVIEASRAKHPETPVLAVTGYTGPEYADQALHRGAAHVLIKPLQPDELRTRVDALISGRAEEDGSSEGEGTEDTESGTHSPIRVMAVSVRPGDAEAGCGAQLIQHHQKGDRVILLTLTHGSTGEDGQRRSEEAKKAGQLMGVRFFVGNAGSGDDPLETDLRRLVRGAINEVRPDLLYVPTAQHVNPAFRTVNETALEEREKVGTIFAYCPGDGSPEFRPGVFAPIGSTLQDKLEVLRTFNPRDGGYLAADHARTGASFWGRYAGGEPAEALELIRGRVPSGMIGH